jgi:hypothetical protein
LRRLLTFAFEPFPRERIVHLHTTWRGSIWRKAAYAWLARRRRALVIHHLHAFGLLDTLAGSGARDEVAHPLDPERVPTPSSS